jgi:hypothetical protein
MERWILEARYAARRLRTRPTYTALAVLTLALGVGGMTAIAGIVRPILVDPLPYPADRELGIFMERRRLERRGGPAPARPVAAASSGVAAIRPADVTVEVPGGPTSFVPAIAGLLRALHRAGPDAPRRPQGSQRAKTRRGAAGVAVLSDAFWRELGADPTLVGKTLILGGQPRTVVGVMPPGFWFPDPGVRLWLSDTLTPGRARSANTRSIGRAADGKGRHGA